MVTGKITGKEGDTFTAGKLGRFKVGPDATVLVGDPFKFNKSNIDQFHF
jgi:rhamnose transport system substrate-binding protein